MRKEGLLQSCLLFLFLSLSTIIFGEDWQPFNYDLHFCRIPGKSSKTMLCFHGMGGDYRISHSIQKYIQMDETLVSFNFPDHGICSGEFDPYKTSFGTIQEILPAIYVLKKLIIEEGLDKINLYGFSAGGGAIINALAVLNTFTHDQALSQLGISQKDKERILEVIQQGYILLDTPLKSLAEIIAFRGPLRELEIIGERYRHNGMEPIDTLQALSSLSLHFIVHFQIPDEVLSNRDDDLFIKFLRQYNCKGTTKVILGSDKGHTPPHFALWNAYASETKTSPEINSKIISHVSPVSLP